MRSGTCINLVGAAISVIPAEMRESRGWGCLKAWNVTDQTDTGSEE